MNAMEWNRDIRLPLVDIRRREIGLKDLPDRGNNTVCLPEMRRGRIGLCVATQIARFSGRFSKLPGWQSPEQAWAQTQGQLAWYRTMEEAGELVQLRSWPDVNAHAQLWRTAPDTAKLPIGYLLSLEGADSILTPKHLEKAREQGLIALGPVHYGPGVYGHGTNKWHREKFGRCVREQEKREAMGIDWMTRAELSQAIPPAYTEFIGKQLLRILKQ
jgi:membrane dipeptidase